MTRTLVVIPIALIVALGVSLLGQQMVQNVPAAAEAAERLLNRGGASVAAPAISVAVPFPDAPRFSDREMNAVEQMIVAVLTQGTGPDAVYYGIRKGGRVAFAKTVQVPLGGTNRTYSGTYIAVFGVKSWSVGQIPSALGLAIEIGGPHIGVQIERMKYCLAFQLLPFPEYSKSFDEPDPANQGWDRGPCQ